MSETDVIDVIKNMPDKFCSLDPIPTWLLKECLPELSPLLSYIVNNSLSAGVFPSDLKNAVIKPALKSTELDRDLLNSYRPVSNLSFLSKVLEKCALKQLTTYLEGNGLISDVQSGYRAYHSCETLLVRMFNDINEDISKNKAVALILLDLSAAFDTIDHKLLVNKLSNDYGIGPGVLNWIISYLQNRSYSVKINSSISHIEPLLFGVHQGSLLGPILFILYTKDLKRIAHGFSLTIQLYADDSQLYIAFNVLDTADTSSKLGRIRDCLTAIKRWMTLHFMKLNDEKTQFIILGKTPIVEKCNGISLELSECTIPQTDFKNDSAKSLGIKLDDKLSMMRQAKDINRKCYWTLSNLRTFGHYLDQDLKIALVKTLVLSKIDYCNALYAGTNSSVIRKLNSTINNAVRFIFNITDWNVDLTLYYKKAHILPISLRIKYKICLLVHKALEGTAPPYIRQLICLYKDVPSKQSLRAFADKRLLLRPQIKETKITRRMFSYHAPISWNELPAKLRHNSNTMILKRT